MQIYIDTDTGTWGVAESNLVIFDAAGDLLDRLVNEALSDSSICEIGLQAERDNQNMW